MTSLAGRVALVTGASGALGAAVTRAFLLAGATVAAVQRDPASVDRIRTALPAEARARLHAVAADVTVEASVRAAVDEVVRRAGRLDVLVNAAGGFTGGDLLATDPAAWRHMLALNLDSVYLACRAALPPMIAAGGGRIVNVASRAVVPPAGGFLAYTVAKAGVIALTQALAHEVRRHGITVNAVLPSTMDTAANREAMPGADRARWVAPASVAGAILFLAGEAAAEVTGTLLAV